MPCTSTTTPPLPAAVSRTGLWVAALRAAESERPDRMLRDPWARALAGPAIDEADRLLRSPAGLLNPLVMRTCFGDAAIAAAVAGGVRQVVLLGAGMDTRAFRLDLGPQSTLFELDLPGALAYKDRVLGGTGSAPTCRRITVEADLTRDWRAVLELAGHRSSEPSVWVLDGVLLYLDDPAVDDLGDQIAAAAAPGSVLLFDAYPAVAFEEPRMAGWNAALAEQEAHPRSSMEQPERWAAERGWHAEAYTRDDVAAGRCALLDDVPRRVWEQFVEHGWLVIARRGDEARR